MVPETELLNIGLTKNEVKIYLALLKIGKSQSGSLVKESKISSGKIYETLNKLIDKGLVEFSVENGIKKFIASDPESLLIYMNERKEKIIQQTESLETLLPDLKKLKQLEENEGVFMIKGFRGIKPLVYDLLEKSHSEIKVMGVRSSKDNRFNNFWKHWHQERVKRKKKCKLSFVDKGTSYWRFYKELKLTECKCVPSISPSAILIIDWNVLIFSYDKEFTCIHINSHDIAKSFKSFFESLWIIGKS
jgi:sugar-specific transcriptional regulator TrmB